MTIDYKYIGGIGCGPAGSMPAGSAFEDEDLVDPRNDIAAPSFEYENKPLVLYDDKQ